MLCSCLRSGFVLWYVLPYTLPNGGSCSTDAAGGLSQRVFLPQQAAGVGWVWHTCTWLSAALHEGHPDGRVSLLACLLFPYCESAAACDVVVAMHGQQRCEVQQPL
jgi:hypothetical protein